MDYMSHEPEPAKLKAMVRSLQDGISDLTLEHARLVDICNKQVAEKVKMEGDLEAALNSFHASRMELIGVKVALEAEKRDREMAAAAFLNTIEDLRARNQRLSSVYDDLYSWSERMRERNAAMEKQLLEHKCSP